MPTWQLRVSFLKFKMCNGRTFAVMLGRLRWLITWFDVCLDVFGRVCSMWKRRVHPYIGTRSLVFRKASIKTVRTTPAHGQPDLLPNRKAFQARPVRIELVLVTIVIFVVGLFTIIGNKLVHVAPEAVIHCVIFVTQINSHHIVNRVRLTTRIWACTIWVIADKISNWFERRYRHLLFFLKKKMFQVRTRSLTFHVFPTSAVLAKYVVHRNPRCRSLLLSTLYILGLRRTPWDIASLWPFLLLSRDDCGL